MKAILEYTNCMGDSKNIFNVLSTLNVEVLKVKRKKYSVYHTVKIRINNYNELNHVVSQLNKGSFYGVKIIRTK